MVKMTPWLPGTAKPVRDGWYLRNFNGELVRSYYEAPNWYAGSDAFFPSPDQSLPWRGLAWPAVGSKTPNVRIEAPRSGRLG